MQTQLPFLLPTRPSCLCSHLISPTSPMFPTLLYSLLYLLIPPPTFLSPSLSSPPSPATPHLVSAGGSSEFRGLSYQGTCERYLGTAESPFRAGRSPWGLGRGPRGPAVWAPGVGVGFRRPRALAQAVLHCSGSGQRPCALRGHHLHLGHLWLPCPAAGMGWRL